MKRALKERRRRELQRRGMPGRCKGDKALLLRFDDSEEQIGYVGAKVSDGAGQSGSNATTEVPVKTGCAIVLLTAGMLQRRDCR
ncbi:MAG: hypothetical protein QXS96_07965 [Candidatus Caldarchaeum sp.]